MKHVDNPEVFLIAEPQIDTDVMFNYLREIGGLAWFERIYESFSENALPPAEGLIEFAGRLCYKSWEPGLNANVTKVREDRGDYLFNVLKSGHGSVLEHANFTFVIHNASRVLTAELNRHRAGIAISEQSLRYVRLDDLSFRLPPTLSDRSQELMREGVEQIETVIKNLIEWEITDDMDFAAKKEKTSAIRRLAPLGLATEEVWTANVRAIRHVITMRSAHAAEEEIRIFADQVAKIMQSKCPLLFGDYELQPSYNVDRKQHHPAAWVTQHPKV
jgi:thymidylate synthase (FAD)